MSSLKVLVTGGAGKTGAALARDLISRGVGVRAIVRSHDERSRELQSLGVETVVADMYDAHALYEAMRGVQRAYFVPLMQPYMIQSAVAFAVAARDARLEHVVQMSQWTSSPSHPSSLTRQIWLVDRLFASIPSVGHTIVNPGMFADNYLRVMDFAALLGVLPVFSGSSRSAPVANEDIARVVSAILLDPQAHAGKTYRPTGPKLLSGQEMADVIARVLGTSVRAVNMPFWMLAKVARMQGIPAFDVVSLRYYMQDHKRGTFEFEGGVNDVILQLTGKPAEDFDVTVRRYAAKPFARRTLSNRMRALASFMIAPLYPGHDLDGWERKHFVPPAANPALCLDSESWMREHRSDHHAGQVFSDLASHSDRSRQRSHGGPQ